MRAITVPIVVFLAGITITCTNSVVFNLESKIKGRWVEQYRSNTNESRYVSILDFNDRKFTSILYRDSVIGDPDTTFTGKYYISKDSLNLVLENFHELFYCRVTDSTLLLTSQYSIDIHGNKIIDFRSVLWDSSIKKNGLFLK